MIRPFTQADKEEFLAMAHDFHSSDAVASATPEEYFVRTFHRIMDNSPYKDGFIIECDGEVAGYGLVHFTYSNEAGGVLSTWDEIYIKPQFRSRGLGSSYIAFCEERYKDKSAFYRLEVEDTHDRLYKLYSRLGYHKIHYRQIVKHRHDTVLNTYDKNLARPMQKQDEQDFYKMAAQYHATDIIESDTPSSHFKNTFSEIMKGNPLIDGFMILKDGKAAGYALVSILCANEVGGIMHNLDELYILPEYRGMGLGSGFIDYFENFYADVTNLYRLELVWEDKKGQEYFEKRGYEWLEYYQMLKAPIK
ncbi:GNAT family N-acetyltransferase [Youxingia wuxianensis]|uniref:GNAT family N-acetyltransferase n=1 Tax=Youxingia wuxianensis TaxID=2763678 RepID=A0A926IH31_9FIRM|nr:GNAT family N-acetyltransferase [Youxingia wuxianensis]MBC8584715.1 GNAT family N-acetyltransferase [Youxingia wuxianensis]